jgi:hypothetical protein
MFLAEVTKAVMKLKPFEIFVVFLILVVIVASIKSCVDERKKREECISRGDHFLVSRDFQACIDPKVLK